MNKFYFILFYSKVKPYAVPGSLYLSTQAPALVVEQSRHFFLLLEIGGQSQVQVDFPERLSSIGRPHGSFQKPFVAVFQPKYPNHDNFKYTFAILLSIFYRQIIRKKIRKLIIELPTLGRSVLFNTTSCYKNKTLDFHIKVITQRQNSFRNKLLKLFTTAFSGQWLGMATSE